MATKVNEKRSQSALDESALSRLSARAAALLERSRYALVTEPHGAEVLLAVGVRGIGTAVYACPAERYDPFAVLDHVMRAHAYAHPLYRLVLEAQAFGEPIVPQSNEAQSLEQLDQ